MFWVISVYFNIKNTLLKSGTFLLGHSVYIYIYVVLMDVSGNLVYVHIHSLVRIKFLLMQENRLLGVVFLSD